MNVVAAHKAQPDDRTGSSSGRRPSTRAAAARVQDNTQVSPPAIDQFEIGQSHDRPEPERQRLRLLLPAGRALGRRGADDQGPPGGGRQAPTGWTRPVTRRRASTGSGTSTSTRSQGGPRRRSPTTMTLPAGTLYIPMAQGTKHWIQAVLDENPFLPFNYFYDEVTWSYSLLRGFAGDGFLTQQLPGGHADDPGRRPRTRARAPAARQAVYAFNTDSMAGLAHGQPAARPGRERRPRRRGVRLRRRALHDRRGARRRLVGQPGDAQRGRGRSGETPVYGLGGYPVAHYALTAAEDRRLHRRRRPRRRTRPSTAPATASAPRTAYCEAMFDLTAEGGRSRRRRSARSPRPTWPTACS